MFGVVGDLSDSLIGGRHVTAQEAIGMDHRGCRSQFVPDREWIFSPAWIGMIEIVNPIRDRRMIGNNRFGVGYCAGWIGHQNSFGSTAGSNSARIKVFEIRLIPRPLRSRFPGNWTGRARPCLPVR